MLEFMGRSVLLAFMSYTVTSVIYYFVIDRRRARSIGGTKTYDDKLSNCPRCGERMGRGFSMKNGGLGWIPANTMKRFAFVGEPLVKVDFRKYFIARGEYILSYHCPQCQLYTVDYGTSCSSQEAKQLAESITATE